MPATFPPPRSLREAASYLVRHRRVRVVSACGEQAAEYRGMAWRDTYGVMKFRSTASHVAFDVPVVGVIGRGHEIGLIFESDGMHVERCLGDEGGARIVYRVEYLD